MSASVYPFPAFDLSRFEVSVTDGGVGDLDGRANGECLLYLQLCLGDPAANEQAGISGGSCAPQRIDSLAARVRWGTNPTFRERVVADLYRSIMAVVPGAEADSRAVSLSRAPGLPRGCATAVIPLSTEGISRTRKAQLQLFANLASDSGFRRLRRMRMLLRCLPVTSELPEDRAPRCRIRGEDCVDAIPQPPFDPPPVTTTTTPSSTTTTRLSTTTTRLSTTTTRPTVTTSTSTTTTRPSTQTSTTTSSTTSTTLGQSGSGRTFYLSPAGNDANSGTARDRPWRSFRMLFNSSTPLRPGDTIVLLDGTYTRSTTGLPRINCGAGGNAPNGTARAPITIRAANERQAFLSSDGYQAGFEMTRCAYWNVIGLRAANADNRSGEQSDGFPFRFHRVSDVTARRLLGSHPNRFHNTHAVAVEDSQRVTLEECEVLYYHRHGFSIWRSRYVTLRRCYANSMLHGRVGQFSAIDNRNWGDEAVSLYGTSDSIVENCISENQANGFQIHGIANALDPSGSGGRRNRILGSISLNDSIAAFVGSRGGDGAYHNARDNTVEHFVGVRSGASAVYARGARGTAIHHVTAYASATSGGISADGGDPGLGGTCSARSVCADTGAACTTARDCRGTPCVANVEGCSMTVEHSLAFENASYGIGITAQTEWLVSGTNSAQNRANYSASEPIADTVGNIRRSLSVVPTKMGLDSGECILWIPDGSTMKGAGISGADIGATVLYRYKDGRLSSERLWDRTTGAFPCGAVVAGVNDGPIRCTNVHERLNVNRNGCAFPARY